MCMHACMSALSGEQFWFTERHSKINTKSPERLQCLTSRGSSILNTNMDFYVDKHIRFTFFLLWSCKLRVWLIFNDSVYWKEL